MKLLILSAFICFKAMAFDPTVTLEYDVVKGTRSDILFVIDNSGSMGSHQAMLSEISDILINELSGNNFKITAISTDKDEELSTTTITPIGPDPTHELRSLINSFGVLGSGIEVPFNRVNSFYTSSYGQAFFRPYTKREVIILTDEDDQSEIDLSLFTKTLIETKTTVSALARKPGTQGCGRYSQYRSEKIDSLVNDLNGTFIDLCKYTEKSLREEYLALAKEIAKRATMVTSVVLPISELEIPANIDTDSIEIFYGSQVIPRGLNRTGWIIDEDQRKILFGSKITLSKAEPLGTKFTVRYNIL